MVQCSVSAQWTNEHNPPVVGMFSAVCKTCALATTSRADRPRRRQRCQLDAHRLQHHLDVLDRRLRRVISRFPASHGGRMVGGLSSARRLWSVPRGTWTCLIDTCRGWSRRGHMPRPKRITIYDLTCARARAHETLRSSRLRVACPVLLVLLRAPSSVPVV